MSIKKLKCSGDCEFWDEIVEMDDAKGNAWSFCPSCGREVIDMEQKMKEEFIEEIKSIAYVRSFSLGDWEKQIFSKYEIKKR